MKPKQLSFPTWGGKRAGAGRKRKSPVPLVSHKKRPDHVARFPLHVVLRVRKDGPRLRAKPVFAEIRAALEASAMIDGFRLVHFSVQGNHLHFIVEADSSGALTRGMRGLTVRVARAINRAAGCSGRLFGDAYFSRPLKTPAEVRRAVRYVLDNHMLHGGLDPQTDPYAGTLARPASWLLREGWRRSRAGPLPVSEWDRI
jgi:REP element-mobilizing transposase RayT